MTKNNAYDIVVVGGGMAGSIFAGVAARSGLGVLLVEREARFRDRVRGEVTHPWGVNEAKQLELSGLLERAGSKGLPVFQGYAAREPVVQFDWTDFSAGGCPMVGFSHPGFQESAISWAAEQGAVVKRPANATAFQPGLEPSVTIVESGNETTVRARLVVGADGRTSMTRRWAGGETITDPEHHRIGGGLFSNVDLTGGVFHESTEQGSGVWAFERSDDCVRVYIVAEHGHISASGIDRFPEAFLALAASAFPEGSFSDAQQSGPVAFFPNSESWPSKIAGDHLVMIGDAAGSSDPSRGHGTSLAFRDVRFLTELLSDQRDWQAAITEFESKRRTYYETIRQVTRWFAEVYFEAGEEAERRRQRHQRAQEQDETLGGILMLEAIGPDERVGDKDARLTFFGENLS